MILTRTPWYYGWNIVAVAIAYQAVTYGIAIYGFTFWVPFWEAEFNTGRGNIMFIFMAIQAGIAVFAALAGRAADRFPLRWLVLGGGLCFAGGLALSAYATALWQIGLLFSIGLVAGLLLAGSITAQTITARWFDRNSGTALGIVSTGTSIGGLLLPILIVYLQSKVGWREANLWLAGLVITVIIPSCLFIYDTPARLGIQPAPSEHTAAGSSGEVSHQQWTLRQVLSTWTFWSMALCFTVISAIFIAIQQNLAPMAIDNGIEAMAVSSVVAILAFVMIGAKLLFGYLADRVDIRYLFLSTAAALAAVLMLLRFGNMTYAGLVIIAILAGIATGSIMPLSASIIRRNFGPLSFGRVKGLMNTVIACSAIGPWVAGTIYDATGGYDTAWLVLGLLLIPAVFASSGLSRKSSLPPIASPKATVR